MGLAAAFKTFEAGKTGTQPAAETTTSTASHAHWFSCHLLCWTWLFGVDLCGSWKLHLLGLRLLSFLGRHCEVNGLDNASKDLF